MKQKELVIFSGGLDSTVLLTQSLVNDFDVEAIHFRYGQKHDEAEFAAAESVCSELKIPMHELVVPLCAWGFKSALLVDGEAIPEGDYNKEALDKTVVPFRNGIMISIAVGFAWSQGFQSVVLGAHAGDHEIYPDCRSLFMGEMKGAVSAGTEDAVRLAAPFINSSKEEIVRLGVDIHAPMELSYSCYNGRTLHCGVCPTCHERRKAFVAAGVDDPTEYETQQTE